MFTRNLTLTLFAALTLAMASTWADAATHKASARLFGSTCTKGNAKYQENANNGRCDQRFNVQISRAVPLQLLEVRVNGNPVGVVRANMGGSAKLHLRTGGRGSADPMPGGFPRLRTGDVVSVGDLVGICFENGSNGRYELEGEASVDGAEYSAEYKEVQRDGELKRTFEAEIEGGSPDQEVPVFVNDVQVGVIHTDSVGHGELELQTSGCGGDDAQVMPAEFPSLQPGDVVRVGDVSVTLSAADDDDDHGGSGCGDDDDDDDGGDDNDD